MGSSVDKVYMVMEFLENDLKACMDMSASPFSMAEVYNVQIPLLGSYFHLCGLFGCLGQTADVAASQRRRAYAQTLVHTQRSEDVQSVVQQQRQIMCMRFWNGQEIREVCGSYCVIDEALIIFTALLLRTLSK